VTGAIRVAPIAAPPPAFACGRRELDEWLAKHALQATRTGSARAYLAFEAAELVGYFALSAGSLEREQVGERTRKGMPRHQVPAVLLARLAVAERAQGRGVGAQLVGHIGGLVVRTSRLVAVRVLVVDALDVATAGFYEHLGFTPNEVEPLRLEVLVKDLEQLAAE
jgi:GNAT superfamily N-acetyltransferase